MKMLILCTLTRYKYLPVIGTVPGTFTRYLVQPTDHTTTQQKNNQNNESLLLLSCGCITGLGWFPETRNWRTDYRKLVDYSTSTRYQQRGSVSVDTHVETNTVLLARNCTCTPRFCRGSCRYLQYMLSQAGTSPGILTWLIDFPCPLNKGTKRS